MMLCASSSDGVSMLPSPGEPTTQAIVDPNSKAPPLLKQQGWGTQPLRAERPLKPRKLCRLLKFSRMLVAPAFDDHFFVGIELDGVASLCVHVAEETAFPAGEGEIGHGGGYADVDADVSCRGFVAETAGGRAAGSEKGSLVAIRATLQEGDCFVHVSGVDQAEHGAENFRVGEFTRGGHTIENGGLHEISGLV